jgi:3-deoxy-7-phosphoheptulonate synthase
MIVVMHSDAEEGAVDGAVSWLTHAGYDVTRSTAAGRTLLSVSGQVNGDDMNVLREFDGVAKVVRVDEPFRLASRHFRKAPTVISGDWGTIGGTRPWIAIEPVGLPKVDPSADPSAPESTRALYRLPAGRPFDAAVTRSPIAPRAMGSLAALSIHPAPQEQQFPLIFVTRPASSGADTWIAAAERELRRGQNEVALIEPGGEYPSGARTLEVAAIARAKLRTHLPIVVDVPSVAQQARYCAPVASAAIGAGADGVILRVWVGPEGGMTRIPSTLSWDAGVRLAERLRTMAAALRD